MNVMSEKLPKYEVIERKAHADIYTLLEELVEAHHCELVDARIALAWINNVKPDRDGHTLWGRAKKVGELEREFHSHDFVILLNKVVWNELPLTGRRALLDHELCHCGAQENEKTGEMTWVMHRHDVESFVAEVRRHGLWRENVKALVDAALKREQLGMFAGTPVEMTVSVEEAKPTGT
jgi:hypothetical protein